MKYTYLLIIPAIIFFAACKKEKYVCQCNSGWGGGLKMEIKKRDMNAAAEKCASLNQPDIYDGNYNCHLVDSL